MNEPIHPGLYEHKDGGLYFVEGEEHCSTNGPDDGKTMVRYYSFAHQHWVSREKHEFLESTKWPDGIWRARFLLLDLSTPLDVCHCGNVKLPRCIDIGPDYRPQPVRGQKLTASGCRCDKCTTWHPYEANPCPNSNCR